MLTHSSLLRVQEGLLIVVKGMSASATPLGSTRKTPRTHETIKEGPFWLKRRYSPIFQPSNQITWIPSRVKRRKFFIFL